MFAERLDVILLDFFMPGGTDLDFLYQHKEMSCSPGIIVLTAREDEHIRKECLSAGAELTV